MLRAADLQIAVGRSLRQPVAELIGWSAPPVVGSTGRATAAVHRVQGTARTDDGRVLPWCVMVKTLREPAEEDGDALSPTHWTYWRREVLAYGSGLLPDGRHGLHSVDCLGVFADGDRDGDLAMALDEAPTEGRQQWDLDDFGRAAEHLGRWQAEWMGRVPPLDWLAHDQLRQRLARTDAAGGLAEPDWALPSLAARVAPAQRAQLRLGWGQRWSLLDRLGSCPATLTHGDFSRANLFAGRQGGVTVVDWAALGRGVPGSDLAHLALSAAGQVGGAPAQAVGAALLDAYLEGLGQATMREDVQRAFGVTLALTATSRLCWALNRTATPSVVDHWAGMVPWILCCFHEVATP